MPRTKPAVRVHLSIAHHPKTADLWSTRDGRAVLTETMRLAAERFAGKRGNRVQLLPADRLSIACTDMLCDADGLLTEVYEEVGWGVRKLGKDGRRWEVSVRNFAKKQGYGTEESDAIRGVPRERMRASESESESESESKSESNRKRGPTMCPESLSEEEKIRLRKWASANDFTDAHLAYAWKAVKDWEKTGWARMYLILQGKASTNTHRKPGTWIQGKGPRTRRISAGWLHLADLREEVVTYNGRSKRRSTV